jgi:hypothetical protein
MAHRSKTITLQAFLHKYFFKGGIDEGEFHRYHVMAADVLRDLAIHHLPIAKTTTLTVDTDNQTADFPDDFIDYIFIAIEKDGRWWIFTRDDSMVDKTITGITGTELSDLSYVYGPGMVGGHNIRWFQVDYENDRFLFNGVLSSDTVVLKYQSTGVESVSYSSTTDIEIPVYAEAAMEAGLDWRVAEKDKEAMNERQWRKRLYDDEVLVMRNVHSSTISEIRDAWLGSTSQSIIRM